MLKIIKAIILVIWFVASIIGMFVALFYNSNSILVLSILGTGLSLSFILDDEEIRNMNIW